MRKKLVDVRKFIVCGKNIRKTDQISVTLKEIISQID